MLQVALNNPMKIIVQICNKDCFLYLHQIKKFYIPRQTNEIKKKSINSKTDKSCDLGATHFIDVYCKTALRT